MKSTSSSATPTKPKRLSPEHLELVRSRLALAGQHQIIANALALEVETFIARTYKVDPKAYALDVATGTLTRKES